MNYSIIIIIVCIIFLLALIFLSKKEEFSPVYEAVTRGRQGPRGPIGRQGDAGKDGDDGEDGEDGERGIIGPTVPGIKGSTGPVGITGPSGPDQEDPANSFLNIVRRELPDLSNVQDDEIYNRFLDEYPFIIDLVDGQVTEAISERQDDLEIPEYGILSFNLTTPVSELSSSFTNLWQLCDGQQLLYAGSENRPVDGVNTPNLTNLFIKGSGGDNSNSGEQSSSTPSGSITINSDNIPYLTAQTNYFSDTAQQVNNYVGGLKQSINNKLNTDFTGIKNNLNKNCRHINNIRIPDTRSGHNHTVNFFNTQFNEYADNIGEKCEEVSWRDGVFCSDEDDNCKCANGRIIYGKGTNINNWAKPKKFTDNEVRCSNLNFGDPFVGITKECRCIPEWKFRRCGYLGGRWSILRGKKPGPGFMIDTQEQAVFRDNDGQHKLKPGRGSEEPDYRPIRWQSGNEVNQEQKRSNLSRRWGQIFSAWRRSFITQGEGDHDHTILQPDEEANRCDLNVSYTNNINTSIDPIETVQVQDTPGEASNTVNTVTIVNSLNSYSLMFFIKKPALPQ